MGHLGPLQVIKIHHIIYNLGVFRCILVTVNRKEPVKDSHNYYWIVYRKQLRHHAATTIIYSCTFVYIMGTSYSRCNVISLIMQHSSVVVLLHLDFYESVSLP